MHNKNDLRGKRFLRILTTLALLSLGCRSLALSATGETGDSDPRPRLTIKWFDWYQLFTSGSDALRDHVETAFGELGVAIEWIDGTDETLESPVGPFELQIHLRPTEPADLSLPPNIMGVTFGDLGTAGPIWVFFPTVVRAVAGARQESIRMSATPSVDARQNRGAELESWSRIAWKDQHKVARAISKVITHEVIHAVAPAPAHDSEGLMRAKLTAALLLDSDLPPDGESVTRFRQELDRLTLHAREKRNVPRAANKEGPFKATHPDRGSSATQR